MFTVRTIAETLGAEAAGNLDLEILSAAEPQDAGPDQIAIATQAKYADQLSAGQARVALLWEGADWVSLGLEAAIFAVRPRMAMGSVTRLLDVGQQFEEGIHPSAVIDPTAELGDHVSVGPLTVISRGAKIGPGSVIGPQCFIGADVTIGAQAFLREMVTIGARATIGERFWAQPGAKVGGDGFSYVTPEVSGVENVRKTLGDSGDAQAQSWVRVHSLGAVTIGDDVEIGTNATIDNGTIRDTVIGSGSKLDNQVHIGHNTRIGKDCLLCGQAGVSGSVDIGNNVVLGGQVGVADNLFVGDGVIAAGGTKILSNVPKGRVMMGYPAVKMETNTEMYKAQRRLPRLSKDIEALKKAVFK
ncbi:MAG: UDP-3-O-(3-hydroxymyristoyl)glucosamine N-acyltransferase [Epibacterium sp.]|nr:UDP-3-O-(3-hydroxymyristoyl)glucosamine N-acyltransferase [Epibacterium sp.]NQX73202.1 UDP-3-O-(3-hydroxymyristoyl)glucosamine N-acyltransferase [Epibacterium sp.]